MTRGSRPAPTLYCSTQRTWQVCQILAYLFPLSPVKITALAHEDSTASPHCSAPSCSNANFVRVKKRLDRAHSPYLGKISILRRACYRTRGPSPRLLFPSSGVAWPSEHDPLSIYSAILHITLGSLMPQDIASWPTPNYSDSGRPNSRGWDPFDCYHDPFHGSKTCGKKESECSWAG